LIPRFVNISADHQFACIPIIQREIRVSGLRRCATLSAATGEAASHCRYPMRSYAAAKKTGSTKVSYKSHPRIRYVSEIPPFPLHKKRWSMRHTARRTVALIPQGKIHAIISGKLMQGA